MTEKFTLTLDPEKLKACIHCGMCLPACPTYQLTGSEAESPRGRLFLMKKMMEGELTDPKQLSRHLDPCLGCQACQTACPSGVSYGELLFQSREQLTSTQKPFQRKLKRWVLQHLLPNADRLNALTFLLRLYQALGLKTLAQHTVLKLSPKLSRLEAMLPKLLKRTPLNPGMSFGNFDGERVALFTGCVMDAFYNPIHWATIDVLVANQYYVSIPEQTCCGALAHHAGETDIAQTLAKENLRQILKTNPDWIVLNSAGCGATLRDYLHLLANDPVYGPKAKVFSAKVVDIMELLAKKPLKPMSKPLQKTVTYHAACHLHHAQKVQTAPEQVLSQIPGLTLVPLTEFDTCCGSAGVYNVEQPELSDEILATKVHHLKATQAEVVVTGNPGCLLQIEGGLRQKGIPMQVLHPIELLAYAYGKKTHRVSE
jgi:glycolate oxidase iron-sulfur subunit